MKANISTSIFCASLVAVATFLPGTAAAIELMPDFANVPTGWSTDRFDPAAFANVGTFQGRDNVLGISISRAEGFGSRGGGFDSTFYNTQGRKHLISGGPGDSLSADLFVPLEWSDEGSGTVRTDMWGVMGDGSNITKYPIIGFTNLGGTARFRIWDDSTWLDLGVAVNFDAWNSLSITLDGSDFVYSVNGVDVFTDTTPTGSTQFDEVIMQSYNFFGDPSLGNVNPVEYTSYWANVGSASVPEPAAMALFGIGLVGAGVARRRR